MAETHLYAVALLAVRLDPRLEWAMNVTDDRGSITSTGRFSDEASTFSDEASTWNTDFTLEATSKFATSEEEAKEFCLRLFRERYPEAEGWTTHVANTQMIDLVAFVKQAMDDLRDQRYAKWRGGASGADDDAEPEM